MDTEEVGYHGNVGVVEVEEFLRNKRLPSFCMKSKRVMSRSFIEFLMALCKAVQRWGLLYAPVILTENLVSYVYLYLKTSIMDAIINPAD